MNWRNTLAVLSAIVMISLTQCSSVTATVADTPAAPQASIPLTSEEGAAAPQILPTPGPSVPWAFLPAVKVVHPMQTIFGVQMNTLNDAGGLIPIADAQTTWTRRHLNWSAVQPEEGAPLNWGALKSFEQELLNASANHLTVILTIESTPVWAEDLSSGATCGPVRTDKFGALADFAAAAARRYSAAPFMIQYFELWNEPDAPGIFGCWGNTRDAYGGGGHYADMLKVVYPRMKAVNPGIQVLLGGLLLDCNPNNRSTCEGDLTTSINADPEPVRLKISRFLEGILLNGGGPYFDIVNFHGYDFYGTKLGEYGYPNFSSNWNTTGPVLVMKSRYLKSLLAQYGAGGKPFMVTEAALMCTPVDDPRCTSAAYETTKAYYITQLYAISIAEGWQSTVWFSATGSRYSGLLDASMAKLPAYFAYEFARAELADARLKSTIAFPGVKGYEFIRQGRRVWVLWSENGTAYSVTVPVPLKVYTIGSDGKPAVGTPSSNQRVSIAPIYLEYAP